MFKESKKMMTVLISLAFLFTMLAAGYLAKITSVKEKPKEQLGTKPKQVEENIKNYEDVEQLQTSLIDKNLVHAGTKIMYRVKYKECGHDLAKSVDPTEDMIGLNRKALESYVREELTGWRLSMFSKDEISLISEKNTLCPNHFVVGEKHGQIAIFKIDENGQRLIHRIFKDASISTVREDNQKRLKEGIVVDSEEEAIQVLEDFIS